MLVLVVKTVVDELSVTIVVLVSVVIIIIKVEESYKVIVAVLVIAGRVVVIVEMYVKVIVVVDSRGVTIVKGVEVVTFTAYHGSVRTLDVVLTGKVAVSP